MKRKNLAIFAFACVLFFSTASAEVLYFGNENSNGSCPTNKKLVLSLNGGQSVTWPGEFDSGFPGGADAGQFMPISADRGNTTTSLEINDPSESTRNSNSFGEGWIYDGNLTNYKINDGDFSFNISLMGGQGSSTLSERIFARVSVINCSGGNFNFVKDLLNTNCVGGSCNGGQAGWSANKDARIIHPNVSVIENQIVNFSLAVNHTFFSGEKIFIEIGFGDANSGADRTIGFAYNTQLSFILTPELSYVDNVLPNVSLISPANNSIIENNLVFFYANFSDYYNLQNATLYLWNSTLDLIGSNFSILSGISNFTNLSISLPYQGNFTWNYLATDSAGNSAFASSNFSFNFFVQDLSPPLVENLLPERGGNFSVGYILEIAANISDDNSIDRAFVNISFPNGSSFLQEMSNAGGKKYNSSFLIPSVLGRYNASILANDSSGNLNNSEFTFFFAVDNLQPYVNIIYPQNISYNFSQIGINYSVSDNFLDSCWYSLNNGQANTTITCGQNVTGLNSGEGNFTWTVYANDTSGNLNFSRVSFSVDFPEEINLSLNCEAGGPYQQNALVLINGNVTNNFVGIENALVNISIIGLSNVLFSEIENSSSDGSFEREINGLEVGNYVLNTSASYLGKNATCFDLFSVGYPAQFFLDKIADIHNLSDDEIYYNITLHLVNFGGAKALNSNVTDTNSLNSPYLIGIVNSNSTFITSYLINFTRQDENTYYLLDEALAQGIDDYSNNLISVFSSDLNISIPAKEVGDFIIVTKNVVFLSESSLNVSYNVSSTLFNAGDNDLENILYIDSDISDNTINLNLSRIEPREFSNVLILEKSADNRIHEFALGTAIVDSQSFYSNRPKINIPGYGVLLMQLFTRHLLWKLRLNFLL